MGSPSAPSPPRCAVLPAARSTATCGLFCLSLLSGSTVSHRALIPASFCASTIAEGAWSWMQCMRWSELGAQRLLALRVMLLNEQSIAGDASTYPHGTSDLRQRLVVVIADPVVDDVHDLPRTNATKHAALVGTHFGRPHDGALGEAGRRMGIGGRLQAHQRRVPSPVGR